jgi:hypothetical protein
MVHYNYNYPFQTCNIGSNLMLGGYQLLNIIISMYIRKINTNLMLVLDYFLISYPANLWYFEAISWLGCLRSTPNIDTYITLVLN